MEICQEIMYEELEISSKATSEKNGYEYEEVIGTGLDWVGEKKQFYVQRIQNKRYEITVRAPANRWRAGCRRDKETDQYY